MLQDQLVFSFIFFQKVPEPNSQIHPSQRTLLIQPCHTSQPPPVLLPTSYLNTDVSNSRLIFLFILNLKRLENKTYFYFATLMYQLSWRPNDWICYQYVCTITKNHGFLTKSKKKRTCKRLINKKRQEDKIIVNIHVQYHNYNS